MRRGPNKFLLKGVFQPIGDGLKLFFKEVNYPNNINFFIFLISPILGIIISLIFWLIYPFERFNFITSFGLIFIFCCSSLIVYVFLIIRWSSNSNYSVLGIIRFVSQIISYEVRIIIIIINLIFLINRFNLNDFFFYQKNVKFFFFLFLLFLILIISFLAEINRSPFDFSEGESELVSGFNIEFRSISFIFIFISEYLRIIFIGLLIREFFFGLIVRKFYLNLFVLIFIFLVIWIRGVLPRFRYDKLIYLIWKLILPISLFIFIFNYSIKLFNLYH